MKNFVKWFGIIALSAIIGFTLIGCGDDDGGGGGGGGGGRPETSEVMSGKTALQYFADNEIKAGWNLGNTLDAVNVPSAAVETAWGNPRATQALLNGVKESGFDMVRIGCTWIGHIGSAPNYKVSEARLQRVAEVVGYAKTAGFKAVVINIHHDGNYTQPPNTWGFVDFAGAVNNPEKKTQIQNQIRIVWAQIAEYFKNYGDYLIFETLNEVHSGNWGSNAPNNEQDILFDWNQAALSAIRATGGNNATRYVAVPGLGSTEPETVISAHNRNKLLPNDGANGTKKLIVSVHFYDPWRYTVADATGQGGSGLLHTWGTSAEKEHLAHEIGSLKTTFIDHGIAVYMGEWGAPTNVRSSMSTAIKNTHLDYMGSVATAARENGVVPILWDDGGDFKCLERSNGKPKAGLWADVLAKIMTAINSTTPPVIGGGGDDDGDDDAGKVIGGEIVIGAYTWNAFNDEANNGTSSITITETSGTINISGNVTDAYQYGFVGWEAAPDATELATLKTATSISFKVKGDGKTYKLMLPTSDITDFSYYFATFTTSASETTITVNINELARPEWGSNDFGTTLNLNLVDHIQWQTNDGASGTFSLSISDLTVQ